MMAISQRVRDMAGRVALQAVNSPNAGNFNDYVKYARSTLSAGQAPNAGGFQQYMTQAYGQAPPGGSKNQMQPQAPGGTKGQQAPAAPVSEMGQLNRVAQSMVQPMVSPGASPKSPRNLQYAAALSRTK